jgi:hypothetical protein
MPIDPVIANNTYFQRVVRLHNETQQIIFSLPGLKGAKHDQAVVRLKEKEGELTRAWYDWRAVKATLYQPCHGKGKT